MVPQCITLQRNELEVVLLFSDKRLVKKVGSLGRGFIYLSVEMVMLHGISELAPL